MPKAIKPIADPTERAVLVLHVVEEWVRQFGGGDPNKPGEVYIPLEDMARVLRDAELIPEDSTNMQARRWLDGLTVIQGNQGQPLERLSLVKRMTGTWVWKFEPKGERQ